MIRKITLAAEKRKTTFAEALAAEPETLNRIGGQLAALGLIPSAGEALSFFDRPERYNGLAVKKAKSIAAKYRKIFDK